MAVEILYAPSCPHLRTAHARLVAVAEEEGVAISVTASAVETAEQARERRFLGSPTVRVEGRDVDPGAESCELFGLG